MIPEAFLARIRRLLSQTEYEAFSAALEQPAVRALRVNTCKTTVEKLIPLLPFSVAPLPFAANAYYAPEDKVGGLAAHHAGMLYMQDPGAISTVAAEAPRKGLRQLALTLCPQSQALTAVLPGLEGIWALWWMPSCLLGLPLSCPSAIWTWAPTHSVKLLLGVWPDAGPWGEACPVLGMPVSPG